MNNVTLTIDGISVTVPSDYTILEAAKEASINIPTLCYLKNINKIASCRLCLVEVAPPAFARRTANYRHFVRSWESISTHMTGRKTSTR